MSPSLAALLLLGIANFAPIVATKVFGSFFAQPLDCRIVLRDGQFLFGTSKTWRGVLVSVLATALMGPVLGIPVWTAASAAAASMLGDLLSSFIKRRLGLVVHAQAFGLDQIPEALLPLLLLRHSLSLAWAGVGGVVVAFIVLELLLSRVLFWLHIRDRPY